MNKTRLFFGYVFTALTLGLLYFNGSILYGSFTPTHPIMMFIFLLILTGVTGSIATYTIGKHIDTDFV